MTAPATPVTRSDVIPNVDVAPGRAKPRGRTWDRLVEGWLRGHTLLIYLFLYFPIVVVVAFSFNATSRRVTQWEGFSLRWYQSVLQDSVIQGALANSFRVALTTAILATLFGTMAALGLQRTPRWFRSIFEALTFVSSSSPRSSSPSRRWSSTRRRSTSPTSCSVSASNSATRRSSPHTPCSTSAS